MGGICTKAPITGPGPAPPTGGAGTTAHSSSTIADKLKPSSHKSLRRESERRGLRQNLVHERKHATVWDNYEIVKEIGHGMTGKVYQVAHKGTGEKYALKCMEMRRIDVELIDDLRNEIELLKMLDHPNVIKLYEYYEDPDNIYLILEFCDGGELFDRLHQQKGNRYSEAEAARLMFKMCAAIGYCHFMGVSHRDLKLENFIFESRDESSNVKLIDFGLSSKYGSTLRRMHTMVGTPYYIAPEVLNQAETGNRGYTMACDCWSLGVIAYMLLSGTPPFKGRRDREVLQAVRRGKYTLSGPKWDNISEEAKDFIRHLLVYNPAKRMTAEQALKHMWLQQARHAEESRPLDPEVLTSLRDFAKLSAFKRAALEAIAFSMSAQSISHLREQFSKLDKDSTGFVSMVDFMDVLQKAGTSREEAASIFSTIDQDHTNHISYTEFLAATISRRLWLSRERIKDAFQRLDVEGTGFITRDNLKELLGDEWTAEKAETMMGEADAKGDGRIDFEEFLGVMTKDLMRGGGGAQSDADAALAAAVAGGAGTPLFLVDATTGGGAAGGAAGGVLAGGASNGSIGPYFGGPSTGPGGLPTIPSVASSLDGAGGDAGSVGGPGKETQGRLPNLTRPALPAGGSWGGAGGGAPIVASPLQPHPAVGSGTVVSTTAATTGGGSANALHIRSPGQSSPQLAPVPSSGTGVGHLPGGVARRDRQESAGAAREAGAAGSVAGAAGGGGGASRASSLQAAGAFAPSPQARRVGSNPHVILPTSSASSIASHSSGSAGGGVGGGGALLPRGPQVLFGGSAGPASAASSAVTTPAAAAAGAGVAAGPGRPGDDGGGSTPDGAGADVAGYPRRSDSAAAAVQPLLGAGGAGPGAGGGSDASPAAGGVISTDALVR